MGQPARRSFRPALAAFAATLLVAGSLVVLLQPSAGTASSGLQFAPTWIQTLNDAGRPIAGSSPMVATLDRGGPSVLIGDRAGFEYAFHLSNGSRVAGWPASAGGVAIDSTASVLGSGSGAVVFVGVGNSARPSAGAYLAINANGKKRWSVHALSSPGRGSAGVQASLTIGALQTGKDVVAGAMGQEQYAIAGLTGRVLTGFPWFQADSSFSTAAVADVSHSGHDTIIEGGDSTAGLAFNYRYGNGGHLRILTRLGNYRTGTPNGGLACQYNSSQVVQSSPAVGRFLAANTVGIAVGTGTYWPGAADTNKLLAVDTSCRLRWRASLDGATVSSPALANTLGNGKLYVVQATRKSASSGTLYVLDGATGHRVWAAAIPGGVYGGVTTADLGRGHQDIIVPTPTGVYVYDGKTGARIGTVETGIAVQSTALVTSDPNGSVGITIGGYNAHNQGVVAHYELAGSKGSRVNVPGAWPMFHHDPHLTGNAGVPIRIG
jgi:PQQ-like domain